MPRKPSTRRFQAGKRACRGRRSLSFDATKSYYWDLDTNLGAIAIRLLADVAPVHVASTLYLTRLGFYDGLIFHRVISDFMAQGGCPLGTGTGGPGYQYDWGV